MEFITLRVAATQYFYFFFKFIRYKVFIQNKLADPMFTPAESKTYF